MQYWCSFVDDTGFLGACIAEGVDLANALYLAWEHGCNPGGEVAALEIELVDESPYEMWRLYSRDEINEIDEAVIWPWDGEQLPQ